MNGKIVALIWLVALASPGYSEIESSISYDAARDEFRKFTQSILISPAWSKHFGPNIEQINSLVDDWPSVRKPLAKIDNPNLVAFLQVAVLYFGDYPPGEVDIRAVGFQPLVFEAIPFENWDYPSTYNDPELLKRGLSARIGYVLSAGAIRTANSSLESNEVAQISVSLTEAFNWLGNRPPIVAISAITANVLLDEGLQFAKIFEDLRETGALKLQGVVIDDQSDVLYSQFFDAFQNWVLHTSAVRPELFLQLYSSWIVDASEKLTDPKYLYRLVAESGGKVEFLRDVKRMQERVLKLLSDKKAGDALTNEVREFHWEDFQTANSKILSALGLVNLDPESLSLGTMETALSKIEAGLLVAPLDFIVSENLKGLERRLDGIATQVAKEKF